MTLHIIDKPLALVTRITNSPIIREIFQWISPYQLIYWGGSNVVELFAREEANMFSESKHNLLRENLVGQPGLAPLGRRPVLEDRAITDNLGIRPVVDQLLARSRSSIPLCLITWVVSWVYASDELWRQKFISAVSDFGQMPLIMSEVFQKTRASQCGQFFIKPVLLRRTAIAVSSMMGWSNTILDPDVLYSETGIQLVLQFFGILINSPGNYIPFVDVNTRTAPPLTSGTTTTFGALGAFRASSLNEYLGNTMYVLGGHSFGSEVKWVHLNDVSIVTAYHTTSSISSVRDTTTAALQLTSQTFQKSSTLTDSVIYIIQRVVGVIRNNSGIPDYPTSFNGDNTSSITTDRVPPGRNSRNRTRNRNVSTQSLGDKSITREEFLVLQAALTTLGSLLPKLVHVPRMNVTHSSRSNM